MRAAAQKAAGKVTDTNFAHGAHARRGEIADAQVADKGDPRDLNSGLDKFLAGKVRDVEPVGEHDDE